MTGNTRQKRKKKLNGLKSSYLERKELFSFFKNGFTNTDSHKQYFIRIRMTNALEQCKNSPNVQK